jgi:hypothetical protein
MKTQRVPEAAKAVKTQIRYLSPREAAQIKGGSTISNAFKSVGDGLATMARKA